MGGGGRGGAITANRSLKGTSLLSKLKENKFSSEETTLSSKEVLSVLMLCAPKNGRLGVFVFRLFSREKNWQKFRKVH